MDGDFDRLYDRIVYGTNAVNMYYENAENKENKRKYKRKTPYKKDEEVQNHFNELAKAAEIINQKLVDNNLNYRFCVYRENNDVFIDVLIVDNNGNKKGLYKRNITHQEFKRWMFYIEKGEGLLFEGSA